MNRKQWFVLGIGLILMGLFFGFASGMNDCSDLKSGSDVWEISCFDKNIDMSSISTISFTLGVIFIILGFLETNKKKK